MESNWQVYVGYKGEMYSGSLDITGVPLIPTSLLEGGYLNKEFRHPENLPQTIKVSIQDGIASINFAETLNLTNEYSSEYTGGVKISFLSTGHLTQGTYQEFVLRKIGVSYSDVNIYFVDKDLKYTTDRGIEVQLKAGWNFWDHNNRLLSQDINDFFNENYRWHLINW